MARKNNKTVVQERRKRVSEMYLRGMYQVDIATEVGVTQQQISLDLVAIRKEWQEKRLNSFEEKISEELEKIDTLEREAWIAWKASIGKKQVVSNKMKGDRETAKSIEKTVTEKEENGDPRYLDKVQWCIDRRLKIIGGDAPVKVSNPDGSPLKLIEIVTNPRD